MSDQTWTCAACRAHNRADQDRCPGCDAPRPASTRPVGRLVGGLVLVVAVGLSLAIARPGAGGDASGTSGRAPGSGGPPGSAAASASPAVSPDPAGASPSPAPAATPVPYTGRLSGTFLVTFDEGLYPSGELLVVKPSCAAGPCSASVKVVDPRNVPDIRPV